jgi:hypothetical protein
MTRTLIVLAVALALVGLLVLVAFLSVPRVRSLEVRSWQPVPQTAQEPESERRVSGD